MEILSVTLKNFKSHSDRHFVFQPGTNAICGENGAGKTSILEAIAWALFNYRGSYSKDDLIRNGSGSAQVTVAFISNRDGRTYEVQRCTTKGYTLYDPQLGLKLDYRHIEDEILPWLRQQLGVAPGTDLAKLFANTIGVPQGTFTADFMQPPEKRKPIFDTVLKVEEYRQTYQQMLSLEKYGKAEVEQLERTIAQYEETLQDWEPLQWKRQALSDEITETEAALQQLQVELATLQQEKERLTAQAQQVQQLAARLQQLTAQLEGQQLAQIVLQQAVQRSQEAVQVCESQRETYQAYLQTEAHLKQLDQQLKQRQALQKQREQEQRILTERQTALTKLSLQLERLTQAAAEIEQLHPQIERQEALEQQQQAIVAELNQRQADKLEQQTLLRQFNTLQTGLKQRHQEIERIRALAAEISQITDLEQKRDRLQEQLSRVEAAKQFESELRQLVTEGEAKRDRQQQQAEHALAILREAQKSVPLLANASVESALTAVMAGVTLNTDLLNALWRILADLSEQVSVPKLQQQLKQTKTQLEAIYRYRAEFSTLDDKMAQQAQIQAELQHLQQRLGELTQQLGTEAYWQQQRQQVYSELQTLGNPKARQSLLQRDLQQRSALTAQHTALQTQCSHLQQRLTDLEEQLAAFAELEDQVDDQKQQRHLYQPGYLAYLQHQNDANQLSKRQAELQAAIAQLQQLEAERSALQAQYEQLSQTYDPAVWQQLETRYNETRSQADRLAGGLPQQRKLLDELDLQLTTLQAVADKRDQATAEANQKKKVQRFISFARRVFKEAGPRITARYVQQISREADRLFRELLNRPNVALQWTQDYDILVQEGAHERRFINLSGGEQMCAALAVRLALLRVLADIDVAFFDEPTTNMDRPRRESLAEAIANIRTFRQLFVISHDDTFEKVTENVILVEREPG